jgi:hypothetical protein
MIEGFNLDNWPIVYFSNNTNIEMDDNNFEVLKEFYVNLLVRCKRNKERMVLIFNLNNLSENSPSIKYIMKFAQFSKTIYKYNKEFLMGVCLLSTNKCLKDLLNIYFSITKPVAPVKICRSKDKANKFFREKLNFKIDVHKIITDFDINISNIEDEKDSNDDMDEYNKIQEENNDIDSEFDKEKYSSLL